MTGYEVLVRGRALAEDASHVKLKGLINHLVLFGRVAHYEHQLARAIVVTVPIDRGDLGVVHVPWSRVQDALSMSPTGWVVGRVAHGQRLVGALAGDADLARERVEALGLNWLRSSP